MFIKLRDTNQFVPKTPLGSFHKMPIESELVALAGKTFDRERQKAEQRSLIFCFGKTFLCPHLSTVFLLERDTCNLFPVLFSGNVLLWGFALCKSVRHWEISFRGRSLTQYLSLLSRLYYRDRQQSLSCKPIWHWFAAPIVWLSLGRLEAWLGKLWLMM